MTRLASTLLAASLLLLPSASSAQVSSPVSGGGTASTYPVFSPRGYVMFARQQFQAQKTFEAIFDDASGSFSGFGADLVLARNIFVEVGWSRFEKTGERVFLFDNTVYKLGIPLTISLRPFELTGGYRVTLWPRVIPYGGFGIASARYEETSDFAATGDDVSVSGSGVVFVGGAEIRLARLIGVSADIHHSSLGDFIGNAGISQEYGEDNLGGTAVRFRIIIGR
jgi:opacity protein-like surface antigen